MRISKETFILFLGIIIESFFFIANENGYYSIAILGFILLIFSSLCLNIRGSFLLFIFLVPNQRVITFVDSKFTLLIFLLIIIFIKIISSKSIRYIFDQVYFIAVFILYSIFKLFNSLTVLNLLTSIKVSLILVIFYSFILRNLKEIAFKKISLMFIFGTVVAILLGMIFGEFHLDQRFYGGIHNNPNIFGGVISFSLACVCLLFAAGELKIPFASSMVMILVSAGLLTQSRSFLLCLMIIIIFMLGHFMMRALWNFRISTGKILPMLGLFSIAVFFIFNPFTSEIFNNSLLRLMHPRSGDVSGGRIELWNLYVDYLVLNVDVFLFGLGYVDISENVGANTVPHNAILEMVMVWGSLGFLIILLLFADFAKRICFVLKSSGLSRLGWVVSLPILILIIVSITGHDILTIGFITQLFIGILALRFYKTQEDIPNS
ncbi:hypothetical protein [uncultured Desulfuromusa sp.]|uniref:hypothetical protein n=1 Tax=uncultured Desulfuromusa sp. TaxID=219183 RepID=UPI002AA8A460|nr:hypothetical protein [uncultured Desulfuromusa sp.]